MIGPLSAYPRASRIYPMIRSDSPPNALFGSLARPDNLPDEIAQQIRQMVVEGVEAEAQFAEDLLGQGVAGLSTTDMRSYLEYVADQRMRRLGLPAIYGSSNPLAFMELQDVQELSNFFERRVSAYQRGVSGQVGFDEDF